MIHHQAHIVTVISHGLSPHTQHHGQYLWSITTHTVSQLVFTTHTHTHTHSITVSTQKHQVTLTCITVPIPLDIFSKYMYLFDIQRSYLLHKSATNAIKYACFNILWPIICSTLFIDQISVITLYISGRLCLRAKHQSPLSSSNSPKYIQFSCAYL